MNECHTNREFENTREDHGEREEHGDRCKAAALMELVRKLQN